VGVDLVREMKRQFLVRLRLGATAADETSETREQPPQHEDDLDSLLGLEHAPH
jgi:hypothetical protein